MDLRRESNYRPESSFRGSRSRSPYMASSFGRSSDNLRQQQAPYGAAPVGDGPVYNQVRKVSPPKDEAEITQQIEQRHEELKRQIALKEQQLANMTGERDTVNRLKQRLGLKTQGQPDAGNRFGEGQLAEDSRRGVFPTSVSPSTRPANNMVGLRSTYAHRQGLADSLNTRSNFQPESQDEPLQFHPTRQPRAQRTSPLRQSKSRSKSKEAAAPNYTQNTSIASFANQNQATQNFTGAPRVNAPYAQQPYEHGVAPYQSTLRDRNDSPLRQRSPSNEYSNTSSAIIRPQPIENINSTRAFTAAAHTAGTAAATNAANQANPAGGSYSYRFTNAGAANPREQLYRDRIEAMRADNESLQRRLNQVSKELERITREKDEIARSLQQTEGEVRHMDNMVNARDDVDAQNQLLRDEVTMMKENNAGLDSKLKQEEVDTANAGGRVVSATTEKNNLEIDKGNMERDLRERLQALDALNREKVMVNQKLNVANNELEMISREQGQLTQENTEWSDQIRRLQNEKSDLLRNLENLTIQYDNTVRQISGDRRNMDRSNDWQTKVLLAKIIFNHLQTFQKARTQNAFTEMVEYSKFDGDCHQKLRTFANVIYKIGSAKQAAGLNRWYINALRPLQTRIQNNDISMIIDCNKLQAKVFYAWRQYQRDKMDSYHFRTSGVQRLWHMLAKGSKQELKRAMDIWKQKLGFQGHSVQKLRNVINRRNEINLRQAVYTWRHYSLALDHACRIRILQMETTQKMFLSQVFLQMRWILRDQKRKRQRMLNKYLKAWQDHVFYNRHLVQTNMAAIAFGQHNRKYLLHCVFNALSHHRECSKYELTSRAVKDDMDVAIAEAQAFNVDKQQQVTRRHQNRAGNMIRDAFGKRLHSYFAHWRDHTLSYKQTLNIKVKSRIIHMYVNYMSSYFDQWKKNAHVKARRHKANLREALQEQNEKLQNEVLEGEKQLRAQAEAVRTSKRRTVDKTFRKLFYRRLSVAMGRWRGICHFRQGQEDRAAMVIKRMRQRFIRQAFDRYLHFFRTHQQRGRNEKSAEHIRETLNKRTLRKHFNAIVFYTKRHLRSKRYWNKILGKMDKFMKQRAITIWAENAHLSYAEQLQSRQHGHTDDIRGLTEDVGKHQLMILEQEAALKEHDKWRTRKAHRQIGSYFLRNYTSRTKAMFTTWKQNIREQVHKEKLLRRTLAHWRRNQLEAVRRVFRRFLSDDRAREHRAAIKQSMIEQEEHMQNIEYNRAQQASKRDGHTDTTTAHLDETAELSRKIQHTMECMERRNQNFICSSRKRMIFTEWRKAAKQEKAFLYCVKNVLEKSMYKKGFVYIHEQMRDHGYTERVHRITKRFAARFFKINCSDAFTRWKHWGLSKVEQQKQATQAQLQAKNEEFEAYAAKVSEVNAARCFKFFLGGRTSDIWRAWVNVIRSLKLTKAKAAEFSERQTALKRQFALRRWQSRLVATKSARHREATLVRKFQLKYHKAAFLGWKAVYLNMKRLATALSNYERKMRYLQFQTSMKCLRAFARSKGEVFATRKSKGTEDIISLITQAYLKRLGKGFQRYKAACGGGGQKQSRLKAVFGKFQSQRMRDAFLWWRRIHEKAELSDDLHHTGPTRAEYWRSIREIENMKDFLRQEKYTEAEIEKIYDGVCNRTEGLMRKYIARLKITQQPQKRLLPIVWQRWREFVGIRKLLKYQLNHCQNAIEDRKADMQRAFKKWRNGPDQLTKELWKMPTETLVQLAIRTTKDLDECGDSIGENAAIQNHLMMQRDEFLNYYIKGQILAMGLLKDRAKFVEMQACSRWLWARRKLTKLDYERQIRDAAYLHANLESQQASITAENAKVTAENKELHQFGQDGSVIRKNKEKLQAETDKFKARIADTDQDYQELLAQNELLKKQVEEAEAKVAAQGHKRGAFQKLPTLKGQSSAEGAVNVGAAAEEEPETSAEKKKRERFERLAKLSQGAGLR